MRCVEYLSQYSAYFNLQLNISGFGELYTHFSSLSSLKLTCFQRTFFKSSFFYLATEYSPGGADGVPSRPIDKLLLPIYIFLFPLEVLLLPRDSTPSPLGRISTALKGSVIIFSNEPLKIVL